MRDLIFFFNIFFLLTSKLKISCITVVFLIIINDNEEVSLFWRSYSIWHILMQRFKKLTELCNLIWKLCSECWDIFINMFIRWRKADVGRNQMWNNWCWKTRLFSATLTLAVLKGIWRINTIRPVTCFCLVGCTPQFAESWFPDQGSNLCP